MELFIANLAFEGTPSLLDSARVGILTGSVIAAGVGGTLIRLSGNTSAG
jgi:NhaA family Na+:H+ antiporter